MAEITSNADEIERALEDLVGAISFTSSGAEGSLGNGLLDVIVDGIDERCANEVDPDGRAWDPNRGIYGRAKRERSVPIGIGYYGPLSDEGDASTLGAEDVGGEMLSLVQLQGEREIEPERATMKHGEAGNDFAKKKGQWFTAGSVGTEDAEPSGAENQPPRPFYEFNETDEAVIDEYLDRFVDEVIEAF